MCQSQISCGINNKFLNLGQKKWKKKKTLQLIHLRLHRGKSVTMWDTTWFLTCLLWLPSVCVCVKSSTDGLSCMNLTGLFFLKQAQPRLMEQPLVDEVVAHRRCQRLYCLSWKTRKKEKDQNSCSYMLWGGGQPAGSLNSTTTLWEVCKIYVVEHITSDLNMELLHMTGHPEFKVGLQYKTRHIMTIWHILWFWYVVAVYVGVFSFFLSFHFHPNHIKFLLFCCVLYQTNVSLCILRPQYGCQASHFII